MKIKGTPEEIKQAKDWWTKQKNRIDEDRVPNSTPKVPIFWTSTIEIVKLTTVHAIENNTSLFIKPFPDMYM